MVAPGKEQEMVALYSRAPEAQERLQYIERYCRPLFGDEHLMVDDHGQLFYSRWREVPTEKATAEEYMVLSKTRVSDEFYLRKGVPTYPKHELQWVKVRGKDGQGSIETAIRLVDKVIAGASEREQLQNDTVLNRTLYFLGRFSLEGFPEDPQTRQRLQEATIALLKAVGLDPEKVILKAKQDMIRWLAQASLGEDSLNRINFLITMQALLAAERAAMKRQESLGAGILPKYISMRATLEYARVQALEFTRIVMHEVHNLSQTRYFKDPTFPFDTRMTYSQQHLLHQSFLLEQIKVNRYRHAGGMSMGVIEEIAKLWRAGKRPEIVERGLFLEALRPLQLAIDRGAYEQMYLSVPPKDFPNFEEKQPVAA